MTFEQFQATKRQCDDLAAAIQSAPWAESTPRGFLYLDTLYIELIDETWPIEARNAGKYHLLIGRDEWISDDMESLERRLYEFAISEGYFSDDENALAICRKWVGRIGLGFHPDTRGKDYSPKMTDKEISEYDADMDALFASGGDPYAFAIKAMEEQGLA